MQIQVRYKTRYKNRVYSIDMSELQCDHEFWTRSCTEWQNGVVDRMEWLTVEQYT